MAVPTHETDNDDAAWRDALAGCPPEGIDPDTKRQADLLRSGLQQRKAKLDAAIEEPSEADFERLLFRLRQEGLDRPKKALPAYRRPAFWGVAASLVLATALTLQFLPFMESHEEDFIVRGTPEQATVRVVDDVTASRDEMIQVLKRAGAEPKVAVVEGTGEVVIEVKAIQAVQDALAADPLRIYPDIRDGKITVVLKPAKSKK